MSLPVNGIIKLFSVILLHTFTVRVIRETNYDC